MDDYIIDSVGNRKVYIYHHRNLLFEGFQDNKPDIVAYDFGCIVIDVGCWICNALFIRKKHGEWNNMKLIILIFFVVLMALSVNAQLAIIPPTQYNGGMEDWCIRPSTETGDFGFGNLNGGSVKCTDANSVVWLQTSYDGTHNTNEIPLLWSERYGCCTKRTTDAHSGQYAALIHKQSMDDWYNFGQGIKFRTPVIGGKVYTYNLFYKFTSTSEYQRAVFYQKFIDSNNQEVFSQGKDFSISNSYVPFIVSNIAPLNAVAMYWEIGVPKEVVGDLYLDDLTIDEIGCTPGQVLNCGSNIGSCKYGSQTCGLNEAWGACIGAVGPTKDVCGDNINNDCDKYTDEGCTFSGYTKDGYIAKFDEINKWYRDGYGTSDSTSPTYWAWDNTPIVEAYINMYKATGQTAYIDRAIVSMDRIVARATDYNGDGLKDFEALESPVDPILTYSRITFPLVQLAYVMKKNNIYGAKADSYIAFVENNFIPLYNQRWRECGNIGFWLESTTSAPNNRASYVGRIHLYLWLLNGKQEYYDKSVKYANKIKSTLLVETNSINGVQYYHWNYANRAGCTTVGTSYSCSAQCPTEGQNMCNIKPNDWVCSGNLELGYGNYDLNLMLDYYEAGVVFNANDLKLLQNTFKEGFLVETAEVDGFPTPVLRWKAQPEGPSTEKGYYSLTSIAHHWARLGHYDQKIKDTFDKINKFILDHASVEDTFYNHPYACILDTRSPLGTKPTCVTLIDEQWDGDFSSTPAYQTSRIGWQLTNSETLTAIIQVPICGNSKIEGTEECDGTNMNGKNCVDYGYSLGSLSCS